MDSCRIGFVFSYILGHVTHQKNLERHVAEDSSIRATWLLMNSREGDLWDRLPLVENHMPLRLSLRARAAIRKSVRDEPIDVLFYHTNITAMLGMRMARRIPSVVSLDATPADFARIGAYHGGSKARVADLSGYKFRWNRAVFRSAAALVSWSAWCKQSLVRDYGVEASKIRVIPPGVDLDDWKPASKGTTAPRGGSQAQRKTRLLFVGGDFGRKGGHVLLEAFRQGLRDTCELDIVSKSAPEGGDGVRVHRDLSPNSDALRRLYAEADLFVFPSRGDCTPVATIEAMACGLPIVATDVGALAEQVLEGQNGLIVPIDDAAALGRAIASVAAAPERRLAMGRAGREHAERTFDAKKNYRAVIELLKGCAARNPRALAE